MLVTLLKLCAFCFFVCGVYFIIPKSKRWWVILAGNIAFYFSFGDKLFIFFCISLVSTYAGGRLLDRLTGTYKEQAKLILDREDRKRLKERITRQKRMVVFFCLLINLGIWAFLKCTDLVAVFGISY